MPRDRVRILTLLLVAVGLVVLFIIMKSDDEGPEASDGYRVEARFDNVGSLEVRAPVRLAGVRIGSVEAIGLDEETYEAVVTLRLEPRFDRIPVDSFAAIFSVGLLGEQYVGLDPGGAEEYLRDGDRIFHTQSALVLEQIVGRFLFSKAEEDSE